MQRRHEAPHVPQWRGFYFNEGMPFVTLPMEKICTNKAVTLVTLSFERF